MRRASSSRRHGVSSDGSRVHAAPKRFWSVSIRSLSVWDSPCFVGSIAGSNPSRPLASATSSTPKRLPKTRSQSGEPQNNPTPSCSMGRKSHTCVGCKDDSAELVPLLTKVVEEMHGIPAFLPLLAACQLDAGLPKDTRRLMTVALPQLPSTPPDFTIVPANVFWAETASRLADAAAAELLSQKLLPYASLMSFAGLTLQGSVADALGRLATVLGHHQEADQYFDLADELNTNFEAPFFTTLTKMNRAEMQLLRDAPADEHKAGQNIRTAVEIAQRHGFAGIERDAELLRQRFGL